MTSSISTAMVASHRVCLRQSASQWLARTTSFTVQRTTTTTTLHSPSVRTLQTTTTTTTQNHTKHQTMPTTTTPTGTTDRKWFSSFRTPTTNHKNDPIITGTIPPRGHGVQVGQFAQVLQTFTLSDVQTYGRLVGDENPLHQPPSSWTNSGLSQDDVEFFQTHPLLQQQERRNDNSTTTTTPATTTTPLIVVHGMLVASLFSCIFGTLAPGAVYMKQSLQFHKPVYVTQPVVATTTITRIRDWTSGRRGRTHSTTTTKSTRGGVVLTCDTTVQSLASTNHNDNNNNNHNNNNDTNPEDATILYVSGEATVWLLQGYPATVDAVDSSSRDNDNDSHPKNDGSGPWTTSTSHTTTTT